MASRAAPEAVALHSARKTLAFGNSPNVDVISGLKKPFQRDILADLKIFAVRQMELFEQAHGLNARFLELTEERLGRVLLSQRAVADLPRPVAPLFSRKTARNLRGAFFPREAAPFCS